MKESIPILAISETCGPCKTLKQQLADIDAFYIERSLVRHPEYFMENSIKSVPTLETQPGVFITGPEKILEYYNSQIKK